MTYDALRRGRVSQCGQWYSVTTVAYHRTPWFFDPACARAAILELRSTAHLGGVGTFAWVLMPDHLHWLLSLEGDAKLADVMPSVQEPFGTRRQRRARAHRSDLAAGVLRPRPPQR